MKTSCVLVSRVPCFDAFRGVAILAVVAVHAMGHRPFDPAAPLASFNHLFCLIWRPLLGFPVPIFFFISGYFLSADRIASLADYKAFLRKRLTRILMPFVVWVLFNGVFLGIVVAAYHAAVHPEKPLKDYAPYYLGMVAVTTILYYFILVLAQFYLLTPVFNALNRTIAGPITALAINLVYLGYPHHLPIDLDPFWWAPHWVFYYVIGLYLGRRRHVDYRPARVPIIAAVIVSALVIGLIGVVRFLTSDDAAWIPIAMRLAGFFYACSIIAVLLLVHHGGWAPPILVRLGEYSFGIYLIHALVMVLIALPALRIDWFYLVQPVYQLTIVLATLALCTVFIRQVRRLFPPRFYARYLGF